MDLGERNALNAVETTDLWSFGLERPSTDSSPLPPNPGPSKPSTNSGMLVSKTLNESMTSVADDSLTNNGRNDHNLRCRSLNARSIVNKRIQLSAILESEDLDVLAVNETFLGEEILDSEIVGDSYRVFRNDRNRQGGGVMLSINSSIPAVRTQDLESDCELLWVELTLPAAKILVGAFYRPPGPSPDSLCQMEDSLVRIPESCSIILCGDFNVPEVNWESMSCTASTRATNQLCDTVEDHSLQQLVLEPTRCGNVLDLLLTNRPDMVLKVEVVDNFSDSDHDAVHFIVQVGRKVTPRSKRKVHIFRRADFEQFRNLLATVPWDCCFLEGSIEGGWMKFKDLLLSVADQCIPKTSLRARKRKNWLSEDTLRMIRKKKRAFKLAKRSRLDKDFRKYRDISNRVRNLTRQDHQEHLEEITMNLTNDLRPFWRWLKNARGHCPELPDLHLSGRVISSGKEKAGAFGEYFRSVFTHEDTNNLSRLEGALSYQE